MKTVLKTVAIAVCLLTVNPMISSASERQTIVKNSANAEIKVPAENFSGAAWMKSFIPKEYGAKFYAAQVIFKPGTKTRWHIHPEGQALIVTDGVGYTQEWGKEPVRLEPGDVVWCPPGVKHWHGAAENASMTHTAISAVGDKAVIWLEHVE